MSGRILNTWMNGGCPLVVYGRLYKAASNLSSKTAPCSHPSQEDRTKVSVIYLLIRVGNVGEQMLTSVGENVVFFFVCVGRKIEEGSERDCS